MSVRSSRSASSDSRFIPPSSKTMPDPSARYRTANRIHRRGRRRPGQKDVADAEGFEPGDVLLGDDPAREHDDVLRSLFLQHPHDLGEADVVRAGENREADRVDVFLNGRGDDLLRGLAQAGVDDFHAGIAKRTRDDFRATVVSVQAGLGDENADLALAHWPLPWGARSLSVRIGRRLYGAGPQREAPWTAA